MAKDYTATDLKDVKTLLRISDYDAENNLYYPASLKITGTVKNGVSFSIRSPVNGVEFLGSGSSTPYTKAQLYNILRNYNSLNILLSDRLRQLYIDAINEDPST